MQHLWFTQTEAREGCTHHAVITRWRRVRIVGNVNFICRLIRPPGRDDGPCCPPRLLSHFPPRASSAVQPQRRPHRAVFFPHPPSLLLFIRLFLSFSPHLQCARPHRHSSFLSEFFPLYSSSSFSLLFSFDVGMGFRTPYGFAGQRSVTGVNLRQSRHVFSFSFKTIWLISTLNTSAYHVGYSLRTTKTMKQIDRKEKQKETRICDNEMQKELSQLIAAFAYLPAWKFSSRRAADQRLRVHVGCQWGPF